MFGFGMRFATQSGGVLRLALLVLQAWRGYEHCSETARSQSASTLHRTGLRRASEIEGAVQEALRPVAQAWVHEIPKSHETSEAMYASWVREPSLRQRPLQSALPSQAQASRKVRSHIRGLCCNVRSPGWCVCHLFARPGKAERNLAEGQRLLRGSLARHEQGPWAALRPLQPSHGPVGRRSSRPSFRRFVSGISLSTVTAASCAAVVA